MQESFPNERQDACAIEGDGKSTSQQFCALLLQDQPCRFWRCGKKKEAPEDMEDIVSAAKNTVGGAVMVPWWYPE